MLIQVFILTHTHELPPDREDVKLIGVYSSEVAANSAKSRMERLPGFSDAPKGFHIQAYPVDKDHWTEGFITEGSADASDSNKLVGGRMHSKARKKRSGRRT